MDAPDPGVADDDAAPARLGQRGTDAARPETRLGDGERPHQAIGRGTPAEAYRAPPVAVPADPRAGGHLRLRYDLVDKAGAMTLRRAGRLHHLGIGAAHRGRHVLAVVEVVLSSHRV